MTATFTVSFAALNIDCAEPAVLADFWGKALDRPVSPGAVAGDMAVEATDPANGPRLIFHPIPAPETVKNRLRPILLTDGYDEEAERLTGLGARPLNETKLPAVRWTTFADPEGNEFDLVTWQPAEVASPSDG
jgi:predicted enzyme related to lactoylglutathione lyase